MSLRDFVLDNAYPLLYRACAAGKVDERQVLFLEHLKTDLDASFQQMYDALQKRGDCKVVFVSTAQRQGGARDLVAHLRLMRTVARSRVVFLRSPSAFISSLPIRKETKVVQLWHACGAFKRFGLSTADAKIGETREEQSRHPSHRNYTLATVSSDEVAWAYREAFGLEDTPGVVKALGISRTDVFFDAEYVQAARERAMRTLPGLAGRKIVLYAPTFRGEVLDAKAPDALDIDLLRHALGDDYALVIKHHPQVRAVPPVPKGCEDFAYLADHDASVNDLLFVADICITDYSSLVFEWSLLRKPIAFFAYDLDDYLDERGFYYDYETMTPGPVCRTTQELADWVTSLSEGFGPSEIDAFRERFMGACDGHATERILHEVFGD